MIDWPHGDTPKDVPKCGFQGELCETFDIFVILLVLALVLLVLLLLGSLLIFKHYKEEADIASMTWKIDMDEVKEVRHGGERPDHKEWQTLVRYLDVLLSMGQTTFRYFIGLTSAALRLTQECGVRQGGD